MSEICALLYSILEIASESGDQSAMQTFLFSYGEQMGYICDSDAEGNIYMTKGTAESYPCAVAHMDTVHAIEDGGITILLIDGKLTGFNPKTMEQTGIGGDDKCGIYAALRAMLALPECKAVFFVDEEIGCRGSGDCDIDFFKDCRYVLQADRRGAFDWVTDISGPLGSEAFQEAVAPHLGAHGFKPVNGMMSDVMALRDSNVGVSVANMSAAYYNPHQRCEYIHIAELENVISLMIAIMTNVTATFPFTYEWKPKSLYAPTASRRSLYKDSQEELWENSLGGMWHDDTFGLSDITCDACPNGGFALIEMTEYEGSALCPDCAEKYIPKFDTVRASKGGKKRRYV